MRSARFQSLVAQQPENEMFRFSLGQALLEENRPREAIPHLELCAGRKADWMMPRILLGRAYLATGRMADAREIWEKALGLAVAQGHEGPEADLRGWLAELGSETASR